MLYLQGQFTQKEIAAKVKATEKSICKWVKDGHWENLRKSMLTTKSEILRNLYNILDRICQRMKDDNTEGDAKDADKFVKYTAAINNLETETSVAQLMEAGMKFHKFLQVADPQQALVFLNNYDAFIKEQLKRF